MVHASTALTPRQAEVMNLVCGGFTNAQIGVQLGISCRTVEIHRAHAIATLGAGNATQAAVLFDRLHRSGQAAQVAVHFDHGGEMNYLAMGDGVRLFIVDERALDDRVYEWLPRCSAEAMAALIPADIPIGHNQDARHAAISHAILTTMEGTRHLALVPAEPARALCDGGDHG